MLARRLRRRRTAGFSPGKTARSFGGALVVDCSATLGRKSARQNRRPGEAEDLSPDPEFTERSPPSPTRLWRELSPTRGEGKRCGGGFHPEGPAAGRYGTRG